MGDRVIVTFREIAGLTPALYCHTAGGSIIPVLRQVEGRLRKGDGYYALAQAVAAAVGAFSPDGLSVGVLPAPPEDTPEELAKASHGDAGIVVIDAFTGQIEAHGGYLVDEFKDQPPRPLSLGDF